MAKIITRIEDELAERVAEAMSEFHYATKQEFVRDAIRLKLKELKSERKRDIAWHRLLSAHRKLRGIKTTFASNMRTEMMHPSRFTLRDFIKHRTD